IQANTTRATPLSKEPSRVRTDTAPWAIPCRPPATAPAAGDGPASRAPVSIAWTVNTAMAAPRILRAARTPGSISVVRPNAHERAMSQVRRSRTLREYREVTSGTCARVSLRTRRAHTAAAMSTTTASNAIVNCSHEYISGGAGGRQPDRLPAIDPQTPSHKDTRATQAAGEATTHNC